MSIARRPIRVLLLAVLATLATVPMAVASHYAYAVLSWERVLPGTPFQSTIRLTYEIGFQHPSHDREQLQVGDAFPSDLPEFRIVSARGDTIRIVRGNLTVKSISDAENLIVGEGSFELHEDVTMFPLQVVLEGCCRLSDLVEGNNDTTRRLLTTVDLTTGIRSPVFAPIPRIFLPRDVINTFALPALIPSGGPGTVTFSPAAASGLATAVPGSLLCQHQFCGDRVMTLAPDGQVAWTSYTEGKYAAQFTATSGERNAAVLDTVIEVETLCPFPSSSCSSPSRPYFTTPPDPVRAKAGEALTMTFNATSHLANGTTTIASLAIPGDAHFTSVQGAPEATADLWWTPTKADVGSHLACVQARNAQGHANYGIHCPVIEVWRDPVVTFASRLPLVQAVASQDVELDGFAVKPADPTTTQAGFHFAGWTLDPNGSTQSPLFSFASSAITGDVTLHAIWTDQLRTVTFLTDIDTQVPPITVPLSALVPEPALPVSVADAFDGWFVDPALTTRFRFDIDRIYDDTTLFAKWKLWVFVTFVGNSAIPCRTIEGFAPLPVSCTPFPREGFVFEGWYLDESLTQPFGGAPVTVPYLVLYPKWTPLRVPYTFTGFLAPVESLPTLNVGQAGRTFPIKWRLATADGTPVTTLSAFVGLMEATIPCDASPDSVLDEQLAESASGGIRYDAADDLFIYNWKTRKGDTGCRLITVVLDDGTQQAAKFRLQ